MIIQSLVLSQNASLIVFKKALVMRVTMVAIDRSGVGLEPATVGAGRNMRGGGPDFSGVQGPAFSVSGPDVVCVQLMSCVILMLY